MKENETKKAEKVAKIIRVYSRPNAFIYGDLSQNIINEDDNKPDMEKNNNDGRERN